MKLTVFNGSPRGKTGNTKLYLAEFLEGFAETEGNSHEVAYLNRVKDQDALVEMFTEAEAVLLGFPLYTDAMPGLVKTFIESLAPLVGRQGNPPIGFVIQCGFPGAAHLRPLERYLEKLASRLGCRYLGTIVKGGGEGARCRLASPDRERPADILRRPGHSTRLLGHPANQSVRRAHAFAGGLHGGPHEHMPSGCVRSLRPWVP